MTSDFDPVAFRHDLHRHPEVAFGLTRTADCVAGMLAAAGLKVTRNVGQSGLVASLERGDPSHAIGLRADMDALPITEANQFAHASSSPGKFHGCGHDGHTTMLLTAALELAQHAEIDRTIHFIFQPDEENGFGAKAMIADGLFEKFPMKAIYGLHNLPGMPLGTFATQPGAFCAFEDNFEISVQGKGGHASMPEVAIDPIVIAASVVTQLQTIVSRSISAKHHAVVSVTEFITDGARNILPTNVTIRGDCRGFSSAVSKKIERRMSEIIAGTCAAHGAIGELSYSQSFRPLVNDPRSTEIIVRAAQTVGTVQENYGRVGFSEDFAEFLHHRPGAFILMGNGTEGRHAMPLHNPSYDFNDNAIRHGVDYWKALALSPE